MPNPILLLHFRLHLIVEHFLYFISLLAYLRFNIRFTILDMRVSSQTKLAKI